MLPRRVIWLAALGGVILSTAIEILQHSALAARSGDVWDVVANTTGATLGVALAVILRTLIRSRDKQIIARALHFAAKEAESIAASERSSQDAVQP